MSWTVSKWENAAYLCFLKIHQPGLKGQSAQPLPVPQLPLPMLAHTRAPCVPWTNVTRHCILIPYTYCIYTDSTLYVLLFWKRGKSGTTKSLLRYSYLSERSKVFLQETA